MNARCFLLGKNRNKSARIIIRKEKNFQERRMVETGWTCLMFVEESEKQGMCCGKF